MHIFQSTSTKVSHNEWTFFSKNNLFPGDYHLINLRTLNDKQADGKHHPSKNMALILRRFAYDCENNYDNSFHFEQVRKFNLHKIMQNIALCINLADYWVFLSDESNSIHHSNITHPSTCTKSINNQFKTIGSYSWDSNLQTSIELKSQLSFQTVLVFFFFFTNYPAHTLSQ